ncbi:nuclear transport factor 2 family protein [Spirosoma sp. HMF3257]|uniref:Nuclear transport factor 2 family protein n=1 Tax=Spirosoma telluris TaxID=2183553 RepID=A0A327NDH6_9BACT|nr:nuclear transport factor 2 family protein [Spirosoma telluris]RAI73132.1 nuclear transport factor 2 family protein [Spirosoma telluris]
MKLLVTFFRWLVGPSMTTLIEDLHVRLLNDWIQTPAPAFIHPHCIWKLDDGHVCIGIHQGRDFFENYQRRIDSTFPEWYEVVSEVIGSPIGGIVIGKYQFQREKNGLWYSAPFTHFYRIQKGQIVSGYYYMGEVSRHLSRCRPTTYFPTYGTLPSLN